MTNFDKLVEEARARQYIAPELILAAYQGMHVDKIDSLFLARVDETHHPNFLLDEEMRLIGVLYGSQWDKEKYIQINGVNRYGTFLYPRKTDANGYEIIPDGWISEDDLIFSIEQFLEEEGLM